MSLATLFEYFEPSEDLIRPVPSEDASFPEVDYSENPTPLFKAIEAKNWASVKHFLLSGYWHGAFTRDASPPSAQVCTWVTKYEPTCDGAERGVWTQLPIHAAMVYGAPENVIKLLIKICPATLRCADDQRMLPLHLAFRSGSSDSTVGLILDMFPEALSVRDFQGRSPVECAMEGPGAQRGEIIRKIFKENETGWNKKKSKLEAKHKKQKNTINETRNSLKSTVQEASHLKVAFDLIKWREEQTKKVLMTVVSELKDINCWYKHQEKIAAKEEIVEDLATKLVSLQQVAEELVVEAQRQETENPDAPFIDPNNTLLAKLSKLPGTSDSESEECSVTTSSSHSTVHEDKILMNNNIVFTSDGKCLTKQRSTDGSPPPSDSGNMNSTTTSREARIVARIPLTRDESEKTHEPSKELEESSTTKEGAHLCNYGNSVGCGQNMMLSRVVARIPLTRPESSKKHPESSEGSEEGTGSVASSKSKKSVKDESGSVASSKSKKSRLMAKIPFRKQGSKKSTCDNAKEDEVVADTSGSSKTLAGSRAASIPLVTNDESLRSKEHQIKESPVGTAVETEVIVENAEKKPDQSPEPTKISITIENQPVASESSSPKAAVDDNSAKEASSPWTDLSYFQLPKINLYKLDCLDECLFGSAPPCTTKTPPPKARTSNDIPPGKCFVSSVKTTDSDNFSKNASVSSNPSQDSCPDLVSSRDSCIDVALSADASQDSCPDLVPSQSATFSGGDIHVSIPSPIHASHGSNSPDFVDAMMQEEPSVKEASQSNPPSSEPEGTGENRLSQVPPAMMAPHTALPPLHPSTKNSKSAKKTTSFFGTLKKVTNRFAHKTKKTSSKKSKSKGSPNTASKGGVSENMSSSVANNVAGAAAAETLPHNPSKEETAAEKSSQEISVEEFRKSASYDVPEVPSAEVLEEKEDKEATVAEPHTELEIEDRADEAPKKDKADFPNEDAAVVKEDKEEHNQIFKEEPVSGKSETEAPINAADSNEEPLARLARAVFAYSTARPDPGPEGDTSDTGDIDYVLSENPEDQMCITQTTSDGVSIEISDGECEIVQDGANNEKAAGVSMLSGTTPPGNDGTMPLLISEEQASKSSSTGKVQPKKKAFMEAFKKASMHAPGVASKTPAKLQSKTGMVLRALPQTEAVNDAILESDSKSEEHDVTNSNEDAKKTPEAKVDAAARKKIFKSFMKQKMHAPGHIKVAPE